MKIYRLVSLTFLCIFLSSCGAPVVNKILTMPGNLVSRVVGPVLGPIMPR